MNMFAWMQQTRKVERLEAENAYLRDELDKLRATMQALPAKVVDAKPQPMAPTGVIADTPKTAYVHNHTDMAWFSKLSFQEKSKYAAELALKLGKSVKMS